jgi:uroporphyrin-III C-methyltransferase/precorrin-2 dehydrogenase/sirohydrochlorin ferrochelatase
MAVSDTSTTSLPTPAVRMEPLAVLPVFFKLEGKRAVMAGGGPPAVWKAELLSATGAHVEVFAPEPCDELVTLAASPPAGPIVLKRRPWRSDDLPGAAIAIGAIEEDDDAAIFAAASRAAGVPVNVIDKPAMCDFQFGTVVSRSPLVIGISTDGAAPVFGQAIRARIEALLPQGLTRWARAARDWRPAVQALRLDFRARRRFWEVFTDRAFADPDRRPENLDREAALAAARDESALDQTCQVALVCAGPGDPDSMTLQAIRTLQAADLIFHGRDVDAAIVGFGRREAVKVLVPPLDGAIPASIEAALQPARRLVWLDKGDPRVCLRWRARARLLSAFQVDVVTVPGLGICQDCGPGCPAWPGTIGERQP